MGVGRSYHDGCPYGKGEDPCKSDDEEGGKEPVQDRAKLQRMLRDVRRRRLEHTWKQAHRFLQPTLGRSDHLDWPPLSSIAY